MKPININLYVMPWQQEIIKSTARMNGVFAGRRAGKSTGCSRNYGLDKCLSIPNYKHLYVTPGYSQSKPEYEEVSNHPGVRKFIQKTREQPYPYIKFTNGSLWAFRSLDRPHLLRSGGFNSLWIDECQNVCEDIFNRVLRALVADRKGQIFFTGQFNGQEGWLYKRIYAPGQVPNQNNYKSWIIPSSMGFPFQTKEGIQELDLIKSSTPRIIWEAEWECKPTANVRAVFDPVDIDLCINGEIEQQPINGYKYIFSLDLGRMVDPSSYVVLKISPNNDIMVIESGVRPLKEKHEYGAQFMSKIVKRYGNCAAIMDSTGGATGGHTEKQDEYTKFYRKLIPSLREFYFTASTKQNVISNMSLYIEQHKINIPAAHEELIKQLKLYEYTYKGSGIYSYNGPDGTRDDLVPALGMALYAVHKNWLHSGYGSQQISAIF